MIRLAVLGFWHETNTFANHAVDRREIEANTVLGADIVRVHEGGTSTVAGYLSAAHRHADVSVEPLVMTTLIPGGPLTSDALRCVCDGLLGAIGSAGPFDAALVALHGAAVAEGVPDVDGYLLSQIRSALGPIPIGVSLDLHANISEAMCQHVDVLNTYRTNPHVDAAAVADEVAELIIGAVRGRLRPTLAFASVPAAINILRQNTAQSPMKELLGAARETQSLPGVLSVTVAEGFPYADVLEMGMSVVVVTDDDHLSARQHADRLAGTVWGRRAAFIGDAMPPEEALHEAVNAGRRPTLLLDAGDNIGGGSPGDSVAILRAARVVGVRSLVTVVNDPAAASVCVDAGVGARVQLDFGSKAGSDTGPSIVEQADVLALYDGVFQDRAGVHAGFDTFDGGASAAVQLATGQTVVLTSKIVPPFSIRHLSMFGLSPSSFDVIVAKGVHSPLASYGPHAADCIFVDSPGVTSANLQRFQYRNRRRPLFPFEDLDELPSPVVS